MGVTKGYPGLDGKMSCDSIYSMPDNVKVGCPLQKGKQYRHETFMPLKIPAPKVRKRKYIIQFCESDSRFYCLI